MRSLVRYSLIALGLLALVITVAVFRPRLEQKALAQNASNPLTNLKISSFRENGPSGTGDEFVEIFNASNSNITASTVSVDPSAGGTTNGIGVFSSQGGASASATVTLRCQIPGASVIPARGHFLCVGSQYSLVSLGSNTLTPGHPGDQQIGTGNAPAGDIPDDAGLALLPFGTNIIVGCTIGDPGCNGGFAASGVAVFTVFDKVGFVPYGPGAPAPFTSTNPLSSNYCEGACIRPVGDASTTSGAFSACASQSTTDFPTLTSSNGRCYGMSGQYKYERRRTTFNATSGDISRDTDNNSDDFLIVSPNPGINVGTNITGITGVSPILGASVPWGRNRTGANLTAPGPGDAPRIVGRAVFEQNPFDTGGAGSDPNQPLLGTQNGPRNAERRFGQDPTIIKPENNPLGTFILRMAFINRGSSAITGGVFRIDDLSTLCGPQGSPNGAGSVVGTGNARNVAATGPNCGASGFSAILKAVNSSAETVVDFGNTARTVNGTVLEDVPTAAGLSPLGGGVDNTWAVNTLTTQASRGDGTRAGVGSFAALAAGTSSSTNTLRVAFQFGVVRSGRFNLLIQPELVGATPVP